MQSKTLEKSRKLLIKWYKEETQYLKDNKNMKKKTIVLTIVLTLLLTLVIITVVINKNNSKSPIMEFRVGEGLNKEQLKQANKVLGIIETLELNKNK